MKSRTLQVTSYNISRRQGRAERERERKRERERLANARYCEATFDALSALRGTPDQLNRCKPVQRVTLLTFRTQDSLHLGLWTLATTGSSNETMSQSLIYSFII